MNDPIAIVGAGMSGAYLAYRLAREGRSVLVVDDGRPGRATGWNPGGINPLHGPGFPGVMEAVYRDAFQLHAEHHDFVRARSGIAFGWRVVDRLFLAKDEEEAAQLHGLARHYNELPGFSAHWMDRAAIAEWDGRVGQAWIGGLMTSGNVRVDAEQYRLALLATAASLGAEIINGTVQEVGASGSTIKSVDCGDGPVQVDGLCMATGSWGQEPIAGWSPGEIVPVTPLIGDLLLVRSAQAPPQADLSSGLTAIYQHDEGLFWIGGTARREGPLGHTSAEIEDELLAGAQSLMPGWGELDVVARSSAARPATPDGLPVVGRSPSYRNGWIINGLGGKGILLSAWTADLIARMISADAAPDEFAPASPGRVIDHG